MYKPVFFVLSFFVPVAISTTCRGSQDRNATSEDSPCGSVVMNLTSSHEDAGLIPGLAQWVKGSSVAVSYGVGHRHDWILHCGGVGLQLQLQFHP